MNKQIITKVKEGTNFEIFFKVWYKLSKQEFSLFTKHKQPLCISYFISLDYYTRAQKKDKLS